MLLAIAVYIQDDTPRKQATDALKESEKRFRNLIRDLQTGVLLMDAEGRVTLTNPAAIRIVDKTEEEVVGRKMYEVCGDVIHEDGTPFLLSERPVLRAVKTRKLIEDVVMGIWNKRRKERVWLLISAECLEDANGQIQSIISTFTDITERKKAEKKSMAEKIAHQQQIVQATIDGQEKERLEIGRELHDNIGQQLTSIKLFLDMAKTTANPETAGPVAKAIESVSNVINEVRSMSRSLVPSTLNDLGFVDSVNDLIDSLRIAKPLHFSFDCFHFSEDRLPQNKKLALFRIAQEGLNNIVKHAGAKNVAIRLHSLKGHILLEINDDGDGFDLGKIRRGLGLTNIINRSELFGGRVEIITSPGAGCTIKVWMPHPLMCTSE